MPGSEIIVSHATFESLDEAPNMSSRVQAACPSCDVRRIVHVDSVRINGALGCAHRYVVAMHARNNMLLHLDETTTTCCPQLSSCTLLCRVCAPSRASPSMRRRKHRFRHMMT